MQWDHHHVVHIGGETLTPSDPSREAGVWRKRIEPWLSAVLQAEHLGLLLGNGFTTGIVNEAGGAAIAMGPAAFGCPDEEKVNAHAAKRAEENFPRIMTAKCRAG